MGERTSHPPGTFDGSVARAGQLGGAVVMGPMDIPNGTRFAALRDPQNAVFSVPAGPIDP
jgi:predicted enzyme related to lactoylglutathione lyase